MSSSLRLPGILRTAFAVTLLAGGSIPEIARAQPGRVGGDSPLFNVPQFVVTGVNFRASNETGWDRGGSDEVHAVRADFNANHELVTSLYGDVDAGETKTLREPDRCIAPQPDCARGARSLRFGIALWERDKPGFPFSGSDFCYGSTGQVYLYRKGVCAGDDLIGRVEVDLSEADLVAALPVVGASVEHTVRPTGGAGKYTFTYRITRLPNAEGTIVIGPDRDPVSPPISLTASVSMTPTPGSRVTLDWTGATANTVDIHRNGALIVTTPNDGQYLDTVQAGTYQYRVCNTGSTTFCSAQVSVIVP